MKLKLKPIIEGAKLSAYAYITMGLVIATGIQVKITIDSIKNAFTK